MICARCQQENPVGTRFCGDCGAPLNGPGTTGKTLLVLQTENEGLRRSLTETLEQQTATAEILRVISSSPTDVQPVFEVVVRSAVRL